jgi:uroporphyrinogen-III synthase
MSAPPLPLHHVTVLVTRSASQSPQFHRLLEGVGATVLDMPALEIGPPSSWGALDGAIARLEQFDWLILTSANGVEAFFERLQGQGMGWEDCPGLKIAVVGKKTAAVLQKCGRSPDFIPPDYVADSLVAHFPDDLAQKRILFPRVETGGREVLAQEFRAQGAEVTEVPAYESRCPARLDPAVAAALEAGQVGVVTFASSKTVSHFAQLLAGWFGVNWDDRLGDVVVASIGPQTSETCRKVLGRVDVEATEYTLEGLTAAIVAHRLRQS